jgi:hypothetical protein
MLTSSPDQRDVNRAYDHQVAGYIVKTDVGPGLIRLVTILEQFILTIRFPDQY